MFPRAAIQPLSNRYPPTSEPGRPSSQRPPRLARTENSSSPCKARRGRDRGEPAGRAPRLRRAHVGRPEPSAVLVPASGTQERRKLRRSGAFADRRDRIEPATARPPAQKCRFCSDEMPAFMPFHLTSDGARCWQFGPRLDPVMLAASFTIGGTALTPDAATRQRPGPEVRRAPSRGPSCGQRHRRSPRSRQSPGPRSTRARSGSAGCRSRARTRRRRARRPQPPMPAGS
jgi:hypothetical protein